MEELLAEATLLDQDREMFAGGHQESDFALHLGMCGRRTVISILQLPEQIMLERHRQRADLIEVEGPAAGLTEIMDPARVGILRTRILGFRRREFVGQGG